MADEPLKSILIDENALATALVTALVNALDGKTIEVQHPALQGPITVTLHLK